MARLGRYAGLLTTGLVALVVVGPLALLAPVWGALALGLLAALAGGLAQARAAALTARCEKLSGEVDLLSRRLLKAESAAAPPQAQASAEPSPLRAEVEELTVEIGLLSGIVRDLAAVVRSQDGEIDRLKALPAPVAAPPVAAAPPPAAPPRIAAAPAPERPVYAPPAHEPAAHQPAFDPPAFDPPAFDPRPAPEAAAPAPRPIPPRALPPRPLPRSMGPDEGAVVRAFEGEGLEIHLQPVVTLPQRKVVAYEALARLRVDEQVLEPDLFLPVLERHGRTTELDRRMLRRTATIVRHLAKRGSAAGVGYGLSPLSLFEPGFLRELGRMAGDDPALAGLVVALPQAGWRGLDAGQRDLLAALRGRIGFSLDRPDDLRLDARDLAALGIGQVKVPAEMLLRPGPARRTLSDIAIEDIAPALARAGIRLVATGVEAEADVPDLIDLDVPFAQGAAFAPPRPVRGEVLASATEPEPPPAPEDPAPERKPFRSFLRRAS